MFFRPLSAACYFITGLVLLFRVSQTHATPKAPTLGQIVNTVSRGSSTDALLTDKASIAKSYEKALASIAELVKLYPAKLQHLKSLKQKEPRQALETLVGPSIDSATNLLIAVSNFINGRTNIAAVDKYINSFITFMLSDGLSGTITYSTLYMGFWVIYDATTWIFRFNERRYNDRRKQKLEELNKDDEVVEEMISTLTVANKRLEAFKNSMQTLICQNIDRSATKDGKILIKRSGQERQIDCSSLLRQAIEENNNNEENDENEEEVDANEDNSVERHANENSNAIPKEGVIPDELNPSSYLSDDGDDNTNDDAVQGVVQNDVENY